MHSSLFEKINELKNITTISKHEQLVNGIINSIEAKILKKDDQLPSINKMVSELGYARKTIVKAYEDLKSRGIVESKSLKGYFISSTETKTVLKVALLLFAFHSFQEVFYNTFRKELGEKFHIDVFFHHNNMDVFKNIISTIKNRYGIYVIAPIPEQEISILLKQTFSSEKLLIIDRDIVMPEDYSRITQEFEEATYNQLTELLPAIRKFKKFILFFQENTDYPIGILNAFNKFIKDFEIDGKVEREYKQHSVKRGSLYFFISDTYLWEVLRDCRNGEYLIGKDIGILAHNDNPVKEIIFGGITTISTDFKLMAKASAVYVKNGVKTLKIIPSEIRRRNSL